MVADLRLEAMQPVVTGTVLSCFSFPPWYWLNTEKYALLDKLKAIKSISYTEKGAQISGAGSRNQKLPKLLCGRKYGSKGGGRVSV